MEKIYFRIEFFSFFHGQTLDKKHYNFFRHLLSILTPQKEVVIKTTEDSEYFFREVFRIEKVIYDNILALDGVLGEIILDSDLENEAAEYVGSINTPTIYIFNSKKDVESNWGSIEALFPRNHKNYVNEELVSRLKSLLKNIGDFKQPSLQVVLSSNNRKKILIMLDYHRRYYLGDSYFLFKDLKRIIYLLEKKFSSPLIYITHYNSVFLNNFTTTFKDSLKDNIRFIHLSVLKIDFNFFELVITNAYVFIKIYLSLVGDFFSISERIIITSTKKIDGFKERDFGLYFKLESLKEKIILRKQFCKIDISLKNRCVADSWFRERGIIEKNKIVILPDFASKEEKKLNNKVFFELINYLTEVQKKNVLIFDHLKQNKKEFYLDNLSEHVVGKIIFTSHNNIMKDMALMASPYVGGIISPCTGIAHLFYGINIDRMKTLDYTLVYTGKFDYDSKYNPRQWWSGTKMQCCVSYNYDREIKLIDLRKIKNDKYYQSSLPVNLVTFKQLKTFLEKNNHE